MLKHIMILILVSAMVTYETTRGWVQWVLEQFVSVHHSIRDFLGSVFKSDHLWVTMLSQSLALFIFPMILTGLISLVFWSIRRYQMPYFMLVFWFVWVLEVAVVLAVKS
jgi:hypothetical protein